MSNDPAETCLSFSNKTYNGLVLGYTEPSFGNEVNLMLKPIYIEF